MLLVYKIFNIICSPILVLIFAFRLLRGKEILARFKERFGIASLSKRPSGRLIWIHATSVGEVASVLPLMYLLIADKKFGGHILLTSTTIGSVKLLETKLLPTAFMHQLCPIENIFAISSFLKFWKPNLALFVESEFWPCLLDETAKVCKVFSINTSISNASLKKWQLALPLLRGMLKRVFKFIPQSQHDVQVLKSLGLNNLKYIGNLKYAAPYEHCDKAQLLRLKKNIANRKIILFISTHDGEEAMAAEVYKALRSNHANVLCVLIPRHIERADAISKLLCDRRLKVERRSASQEISKYAEVYLVDTMGEVNLFAQLAPIAVMGGTFVPIGGHNIIEPTRCGAVVIAGPYMNNFKNLCEEFSAHKAALFVRDKKECIQAIENLWADKKLLTQYRRNAVRLLESKKHINLKIKQLILRHLDV